MNSWTPLVRAGRLGALAALVVLAACRPDVTEQTFASLQIEWVDGNGAVVQSREPVYDFGPVFRGKSETRTLIITNNGRDDLSLVGLEVIAGEPSEVGLVADAANVVFTVPVVPNTVVSPGKEYAVDILFTPAPDTVDPTARDYTFRLKLTTSGTREGEGEATITLKGQAVPGVCDLPATLDFGTVARGDTGVRELLIDNPSKLEATAMVGEVESTSGDSLAFRFEDGSARGTVSIVPGGEARVAIGFSPTEARSYLATVKMRASDACPEVPVTLTGKGVDQVLTWRVDNQQFCKARDEAGACIDTIIQCGFVTPNTVSIERTVTFMNAGNKEVEVKQLRFSRHPTEFFVVGDVGVGTANPLKVPANSAGVPGEASVTVACQRSALGPVTAVFTGNTNLPAQDPFGQVQAFVVGGGPDIVVRPGALNFGPVAYFADATTPVFVERRMVLANEGTLSENVLYNLHLGQLPDGSKAANWYEIEEAEGTEEGTFSVELAPGSTLPEDGLVAKAGQNQLVLRVRVTPQSFGAKAARLTFISNDPDSPRYTVDLSADVRDLPPCNYSVTPSRLHFGLVEPATTRELQFTITNLAPNEDHVCLISNFQTTADSDPAFSLPEYVGQEAQVAKELLGGQSMQVLARVQPQGGASDNISSIFGTAEFFVSSPDRPRGEVRLEANVAKACLVVVPSDLDFGVVQKDCNSQLRTFSLYNSCPSEVKVLGFNVLDGAGQQGGQSEACPGSAPCPEFSIVQQPQIPNGGLDVKPGAQAINFMVRYRPIDYTSDMGSIAVNALQNQQAVSYVVTVRGRGDTQGLNTEVFAQDSEPKADVLFCIDNSGSMGDEQEKLGDNFANFIQYAETSGVDYRMAAIVSDLEKEEDGGRFRPVPDSGERFLTRSTPGLAEKFIKLVNVGTNGSASEQCFEPVLRALTAPLVTNENAGFMREDATLAVVAITDEHEQSDQLATYYLQRFLEFKGFNRPGMFTFSAIASFDGSCTTAENGRYAFMVEQTKGLKGEICLEDWSDTLEELGKTATGYRTSFSLGSQPDLSGGKAIVVELTDQEGDTIRIDPKDMDGNEVWRYDSVSNSVVFTPSNVPEPGQVLSVTYNTVCYGN